MLPTALAAATDKDDTSSLVEAFLVRKGGSDQLAAALEKQQLSADNAKRILRDIIEEGNTP